jgi:hypothetical protein
MGSGASPGRADQSRSKAGPRLTGVRAVAAGAFLYTAGWAMFTGRRFLGEQLSSNQADDDKRGDDDEPEAGGDDSQPSLELPQQRWPRMAAGTR